MFSATDLPQSTDDRFIPLDGPVNFRDLGGYPVGRDRRVKTGLLFRSDGHDRLTPGDVDTLTDRLGIANIIDLRTLEEVERSGPSLLVQQGVAWHHLPIVDRTQQFWDKQDQRLSSVYLTILHEASERLVAATTLIAELEGPTVFHCAAGKDRTGLLAAFVLELLGVDDDVIAADYALTAVIMPTMRRRFEERLAGDPEARKRMKLNPMPPGALDEMLSARASTIQMVLTALRAEHGSIATWMSQSGLDDTVPNRLRDRFTEPQP